MKFTDNETIRNVADVAAKIMFGQSVQDEPEMISEELKGKQHKIDKNKNGKIDGEDFKLLRKEEETTEEETIDEVKMADLPSRKVQGRSYGASAPDVQKPYKAPSKKDLQDIESNNKKKKSSFTEMISNYQLVGLKSLSEWSKKDDVEQIDELSNDTLKNYTDKAKAVSKNAKAYGSTNADPDDSDLADKNWNKHEKLEKGIKKATAKMNKEEVEELDEASTYKLGRAAAETKDFPIHHNGEHVGRLEFHTSAGKLHHRVSSIAGVPHEKFIGHPDREKMTNTHVAKHEAEARKHFAKKIKEEVEPIEEGERSENYIGTVHKSDPDYANKVNALKSQAVGGHRIRGRSPAPEHKEKYQAGGELKRSHQDVKPEHATKVDVYGRKGVKKVSEEVEQIEEREMTDTEMKKREDIVKGMKKGMQGFKDRYGDKAKNVMYATATKQAMKD